MSRTQNYCFTHNNYPNTIVEDEIECQYIIYGKEVGDSGTPHLQGLVRFKQIKSLKQAIGLLPGSHVEATKSLQAAIEYCKKEGDYTERGTPPVSQKEKGEKEKRKWKEIREAAEEGRYDDIPEDLRFTNHSLIKAHRISHLRGQSLVDTEVQHEWYYGKSGSGKSRKAREENPDAYLKTCNKWWDGYENEQIVIIEDLDKKHDVLGHHLKIWGDRYPFPCEVKGGIIKIRPEKVIITSNYHPSEIWSDDSTLEPILRRFKTTEFKTLKTGNKPNPPKEAPPAEGVRSERSGVTYQFPKRS